MLALTAQAEVIQAIADACTNALKAGKKVMFCGNGGSAADSWQEGSEDPDDPFPNFLLRTCATGNRQTGIIPLQRVRPV